LRLIRIWIVSPLLERFPIGRVSLSANQLAVDLVYTKHWRDAASVLTN